MPKSRRRKKKSITTKNNHSNKKGVFKKGVLEKDRLEKDLFIYECKCIALKRINIGNGFINQGDVFYLKDAFVDIQNGRKGIFLGIKLPDGRIWEAGFLHPMAEKIKSKKDMDEAIYLTLIAPYIDGAAYTAIG
jgi:hypothetical protein